MARALSVSMQTTTNSLAVLRGIGRHSYRMGLLLSQAHKRAAISVDHPLTTADYSAVTAGWSAERAESI